MEQSGQVGQRVWFITGTSLGFGRELAAQLLKAGQKVVATSRRPEQLAELIAGYSATALAVRLDVNDAASVEAAVKAAIERFGRVDVLINNAGYGLAGAVEEATEAEFMPVFETNVFGLIRLTRALLPQFRKQRSGHIVNLSSIGGLIGSPGWAYYNATKFEPGPFRTEFLGQSGVEAAQRITDYDQTAGKTREYFQTQGGKQAGDPERAAAAIIAAVESPEPPKHLLLGKIALTRFRKRLEDWKTELDRWEATTVGADYPASDSDSPTKDASVLKPAGESR
jgi:NADP-dependent 3-hydroxy acid dehydrogenase YdfG